MTIDLRTVALLATTALFAGCTSEQNDTPAGSGGDASHSPAETPADNETPTSQPTSQPKRTGKLLDESKWQHSLQGVSEGDLTPVATVMADPAKFNGKHFRVSGQIESVCPVKGCWVRIGEGEKTMKVDFEPYSAERGLMGESGEIVFEGHLEVSETPVADRKHYAEDAGKSAEEIAKITEPKVEAKFKATGYARPRSE